MSDWYFQHLTDMAVVGLLLMIYADQRSSRIAKHGPIVIAHLVVIYLIGLGLVIKLFLELVSRMR